MTETVTDPVPGLLDTLKIRALQPIDPRELAAFRVLFGALLLYSTLRFVWRGWIQAFYLDPGFHFTWAGLDWVSPWPDWGMNLHFATMALAATGIMLGAWTRASAAIFFVLFTYIELLEKATYLNHYYFVSLMVGLMVWLPLDSCWSINAARKPALRTRRPGAWVSWVLRAQVGVVYVFAGLAKLDRDWLLEAQPLRIWLASQTSLPLIGPWMDEAWVAYLMSWSGAAYDLTIVGFLLWSRTRPVAYLSVVVFHVATWLLFPIGVFPWVMIASATLFFAHDWPKRWFRGTPDAAHDTITPSRPLAAMLFVHLTLQVLLPMRCLLYPGPVNWTEEGFRFAWRVMLIEKSGHIEYEVRTQNPAQSWRITPRRSLQAWQHKSMSTQPDMIHHYAHHLRDDLEAQGYEGVQIYAHAFVSYNGRPSQRLIDPGVDLAAQARDHSPKAWILPLKQP